MLELSGAAHDRMTLSYGGDTLNTAVYLARLGRSVDYLTALGDDPYSDWMIDEWQAEVSARIRSCAGPLDYRNSKLFGPMHAANGNPTTGAIKHRPATSSTCRMPSEF